MKLDKKKSKTFIFMKKLIFDKKKLKKGFSLPFLKNLIDCPGSVVAYHPSLSSLGPGSESRPGRYTLTILFLIIHNIEENKEKYKSLANNTLIRW